MPLPFRDFPYEKMSDLGEVIEHNAYVRPVYKLKWGREPSLSAVEDQILYGSRLLIKKLLAGLVQVGLPKKIYQHSDAMKVRVRMPKKDKWRDQVLLSYDGVNVKPRTTLATGIVLDEVLYATSYWFDANEVEEGDSLGLFPSPIQRTTITVKGGTQRQLT